jgi:hypothetical protein
MSPRIRIRTVATVLAGAALAGAPIASAQGSAGTPGRDVPPPPSSIAASAAKDYAKLRQVSATSDTSPVDVSEDTGTSSSSGGLDVPSVAIGAGIAGLIVLLLASGGVAWRRGATARHDAART